MLSGEVLQGESASHEQHGGGCPGPRVRRCRAPQVVAFLTCTSTFTLRAACLVHPACPPCNTGMLEPPWTLPNPPQLTLVPPAPYPVAILWSTPCNPCPSNSGPYPANPSESWLHSTAIHDWATRASGLPSRGTPETHGWRQGPHMSWGVRVCARARACHTHAHRALLYL